MNINDVRNFLIQNKNDLIDKFDQYLKEHRNEDFVIAHKKLEELNKTKDFNNTYYKILLFSLYYIDNQITGSDLRNILICNDLIPKSAYGKLTSIIQTNNNQLIIKDKINKYNTYKLTELAKNTLNDIVNIDSKELIINISSYRPLLSSQQNGWANLDFSDYFKDINVNVPTSLWEKMYNGIREQRHRINTGKPKIKINSYTLHQTLGFLLGYVFGNYNIEVSQFNKSKNAIEYWSFVTCQEISSYDRHWNIKQSDEFRTSDTNTINDIVVIINVSGGISAYIKDFLARNNLNLPIIEFIIKSNPSKTSIKDSYDASCKIQSLEEYFNNLTLKYPIKHIHLFYRAPIAFLMIHATKIRKKFSISLYNRNSNISEYYFTIEVK